MRREGLRGEGVGVMNQSANLDISRTGSKLGGRKGRGDRGGAGLGEGNKCFACEKITI